MVGERRSRIDRSGIDFLNRPRPTQGCRVNRRRRGRRRRRRRRRRRKEEEEKEEEELKRMKIVGWRAKVEDRQEWNRIVEQTETHPGL